MTKTLICLAMSLLFLVPAGAQEKDSRTKLLLSMLQRQQKEAAEQLNERMKTMIEMVEDLRRSNQHGKADLLARAIKIIQSNTIQLAEHAGEDDQLADLRTVLRQMARILEERPDAIDEVQDLAKAAVDVLDRIVSTLLDRRDIDSLEEREAAIRSILNQARRLADRQAELKRQTRLSMPRTDAEQAAMAASKELRKLEQQLVELERQARRQLAELERAREWASRLGEMVQRQQRLHNETKVRAGEADKLTPKMNAVLAELDALVRAAERAADSEDEKATLGELAREVDGLWKRQRNLAASIGERSVLERAAKGLREGRKDREALTDAAKAAKGDLKQALEDAAKNVDDQQAAKNALKGLSGELQRSPSRETLRRDQKSVERDVERALLKTPASAQEAAMALNEARRQSAKAADQLGKGIDATDAATKAAGALEKARRALKAGIAKAVDATKVKAQEAERRRAAERAKELAKELDQLSEQKATQDAGLAGLVDQARDAARRAAEEMQQAADAGARGDAHRARDQATAAKERAERARKELREGMEERHDLTQRQGKIARDLQSMASGARAGNRHREAALQLEQAGNMAKGAQDALRAGDMKRAAEQQKQVLDKLSALKRQADAAVASEAGEQRGTLQKLQARTDQAGKKAGSISRNLKDAVRNAKENDARRRLQDAQERTQKAQEALRRSLVRLRDAMPKSAEQDRREAKEEIQAAQRSLKGLRESHRNPDKHAREQMKQIGNRQKQLEDQVKLLEERLKRLKEQSGGQRLQDAQSAMREAQQHLQQGEADEAERAQDRAEKSLKEAERELANEERRYRNLRQYELLFKLKDELKAFRRSAQANRERLVAIAAKVRAAGRVTRSINKAELKPLLKHVRRLERDVADKSAAIEKERAIVYTYILKGCASDLKEVDAQLAMKEVGLVPQELLGDVVRRFDMAIAGLERNLHDREEDRKQQDQQDKQRNNRQANNGKPLLVPPDAEVRMVMVLQKALNQEREDFFTSRPDFGSKKPTASEKARLERLYHKQGSLAELFDSLRQALISSEADTPAPEESPDDGGEK